MSFQSDWLYSDVVKRHFMHPQNILVDEKDADVAIEKYLLGTLVEVQNRQLCMCCKGDCLKI